MINKEEINRQFEDARQGILAHPEDGKVYFDQLYTACFPYAREVGYKILKDPQDAEEVAQDTLVRVCRGIKKFRGDSKPTTWLYRIAENLAINRQSWNKSRGSQKNVSLEQYSTFKTDEGREFSLGFVDERGLNPRERKILSELEEQYLDELAALPEVYRQTLTLRNIEAMSYEEIADLLDCGMGTLKSRISKARGKLRERLDL